MNRWVHPACIDCFSALAPGREPVVLRVTDPRNGARLRVRRTCCFCSRDTDAGIFARRDPATVGCHGALGYHANGGFGTGRRG